MPKLIRYCEGLMEAAWLAALLSIPLFFSAWGEGIQSEKNYLLRALAIVVATAWTIKALGQLGNSGTGSEDRFSALVRTPLVLPVALYAGSWIIATFFSLSPRESFWGVYFVREGTSSFLCAVLIFAAMTTHLRSAAQVDRVITVAILSSLPVCLYAIGQRHSIEPVVISQGRDTFRVGSTMGNPVHLGAFLIMVVPLTLSRILLRLGAWPSVKPAENQRVLEIGTYGLVGLLQIVAIIFTVSRGPILGLACGLSVLILMLAAYRRQIRLAAGILGAALLLSGGVLLLSSSDGPWRSLARIPELGRFTEMLDPESGSSGRGAIWRLAAQAASFSKTIRTPDGQEDNYSKLRFWVGYGPETIVYVSRLYRSADLNSALGEGKFDRFHNEFWDSLIATGALGTAAYLSLTFLIFYHGCRWLGFLRTPRHRAIFWSMLLGGSMTMALGMAAWLGLGFSGLGLRLGSAIGLVGFLLWATALQKFEPSAHGMPENQAWMLMALLAGILAHLIEINFGFTMDVTLLYFWACLSLFIIIGYRAPDMETPSSHTVHNPEAPSRARHTQSSGESKRKSNAAVKQKNLALALRPAKEAWRDAAWASGILILLLASTGFMIMGPSGSPGTIQTLIDALTRLPGSGNAFTWSLLISILLTVLAAGFLLWSESRFGPATQPRRFPVAAVVLISLGVALSYWLVLAAHNARMLVPAQATLHNLDGLLRGYSFATWAHYSFTFVVILVWAWFLSEPRCGSIIKKGPWRIVIYGGAVLITLGGVTAVGAASLKPSLLGVRNNLIEYFLREKQFHLAAALAESAIAMAPRSEEYYRALGRILTEQASASQLSDEQTALFSKAGRIFRAGQELRPLNPDFLIERGDLYSRRALLEAGQDTKESLSREALACYRQAAILDPGNFDLRNKIAQVELVLLGSPDAALLSLQQSLALHPKEHKTYGLLGDVFSRKGMSSQNRTERESLLWSAATNYQEAVRLAATNGLSQFQYLYSTFLGNTFTRLSQWPDAIAILKLSVSNAPPAERWKLEETLAKLYTQMKDLTNAIVHWERALAQAPPERRPGLTNLHSQIISGAAPTP